MSTDDTQIKALASVPTRTRFGMGYRVVVTRLKIDLMTKHSRGYTYAFADADDASGGSVSFKVPDGGNGIVTVLGEGRTLTMTNGSFRDSFAGHGVHLYRIR